MIPYYQLCKDRGCSHWNEELMDCPLLPDECEYAVDHLLLDDEEKENQSLDGMKHGMWRTPVWANIRFEAIYVNGRKGDWRYWIEDDFKDPLQN